MHQYFSSCILLVIEAFHFRESSEFPAQREVQKVQPSPTYLWRRVWSCEDSVPEKEDTDSEEKGS